MPRKVTSYLRLVLFLLAVVLAIAILIVPLTGDHVALAYPGTGIHSNDVVGTCYRTGDKGDDKGKGHQDKGNKDKDCKGDQDECECDGD